VLDPVKRRLVRYDLTGRYLGQVLGVSPVADDIAPLPDGRILISDDPSDRSRLRVLTPGSHNGLPGTLYPAIDVHGDGPDGSPETLFRLAWASGTTGVWTSAGMRPLTAGLTLDRQSTSLSLPAGGILTATSSGDADWSFTDGRRSWQVTFTSRTDPSPIVTIETLQEHAGSLYLWVSRGSADVAPAAGGSPRFLVILPATGAPRAVPVADTNQVFEDANVHRHFNVTGDGRVVQMLIRRHQVLFTRLPT
jgi:hypothetical protein